MKYKTKPTYGDLQRMANLKRVFKKKVSDKKAETEKTPKVTIKSPKCFVGYGGAGNHLNMNILAYYGKQNSDWQQYVSHDGAHSTTPCPMLVMRTIKETEDGIFYEMPPQNKLGGSYTFSHSCRESMRSYMPLLRNATGKKMDELITKLSLGFKTVELDNALTTMNAEGALRVFNLIEERFGWKKTILDVMTGDDLYFVGDHAMTTTEESTDQLQMKAGFREAAKELITFYMFRPDERWLKTAYTHSLFYLFMRLALTGIFDKVTTYDEFNDSINKLCKLDKYPMTSISRKTPVDMFSEHDVNISLNRDIVHYRVIKNYWELLLENIDAVVDTKYENRSELSDYTFGITAFIVHVMGTHSHTRPDVHNFREVIRKKYN